MISDLEKMNLFIEGNWDPIEKIIRDNISQEIIKNADGVVLIWLAAGLHSEEFIKGFLDSAKFCADIALGKEE